MFDPIPARFSQHRRTITAAIWLTLLFLFTGAAFARFIFASIERERSHHSALFDRDLRELAARLDADERAVLQRNLSALLPEDRLIQPLILPRQYFVSLPAGNSSFIPRPPPRNCYVDLVVATTKPVRDQATDRFCAYFTSNRALGSYLFLAMSFAASSVVPLRPGDVAINADAIRLFIKSGERSALWWLALQPPKGKSPSSNRFEVTAIREEAGGRRERDHRIEGWAYRQQQPDGTAFIHLIARLNYHAIVPQEKAQQNAESPQSVAVASRNTERRGHRGRAAIADNVSEPWPPKDWQNVTIQLDRKVVDPEARKETFVSYSSRGVTNLSVSALSIPFTSAYAAVRIREQLDSGEQRFWTPLPPASLRGKVNDADSWIRFVNGDIQIQLGDPLARKQIIPDTTLVFEVTHPGIVVEKSVWQTAVLLALASLGILGLARHFWKQLLKPISVLSANATALARSPVGSEQELPYGNSSDEVGTLSRAFNDLLNETRMRATREQIERETRNDEARQKHLEELKAREISLKTIGHEIRSPLQALLGLHNDESDPSRRYIDRMIRAVNHLFGNAGPAAFDSVPIDLQLVDIADFLFNQAINAATAQSPIKNVKYDGPRSGVACQVDPDAFEDTVAHILENAERFRTEGTPIRIHLANDADIATISISNDGPWIPEDLLEKIFEFGFSPTDNRDESNQGIGLCAARNYVSRMKGHIKARNTASGVEFIISFPVDK